MSDNKVFLLSLFLKFHFNFNFLKNSLFLLCSQYAACSVLIVDHSPFQGFKERSQVMDSSQFGYQEGTSSVNVSFVKTILCSCNFFCNCDLANFIYASTILCLGIFYVSVLEQQSNLENVGYCLANCHAFKQQFFSAHYPIGFQELEIKGRKSLNVESFKHTLKKCMGTCVVSELVMLSL